VPRCWTYETAVLLGEGDTIKDALPYNDYFEYFGPDYRLHLPVSNMENLNSREYLDRTKVQLLEILREVEPVPGTQISTGGVESNMAPRGIGDIINDSESGITRKLNVGVGIMAGGMVSKPTIGIDSNMMMEIEEFDDNTNAKERENTGKKEHGSEMVS